MASSLLPFRQLVLKVHSRCDLACDHCYVYESADQSWRTRPRVVSRETAALVGVRLAEHARAHGLGRFTVVLHGGEPLLAGPEYLSEVVSTLRAKAGEDVELDVRIHTNGVLLDERFCAVFDRHDVRVSVSLDGDEASNDRHRRHADGRTSYAEVRLALALLRRPEFRHLYNGLLCTVDVTNDPIHVYEALLAEEPPRVDFLLPHSTWDSPPPRPVGATGGTPDPTAYADWLIAIYDRWCLDGRPMGIRVFESIESTLGGGPPLVESLGLAPVDLVVVETDGEIEQVDALKVSFAGAPATGLHVARDPLDTAAAHPGLRARQRGLEGLSEQCRACTLVQTCGGGHYPHRYRGGNGFENPSVFCTDLTKLIKYIEGRKRRVLSSAAPEHALTSESMAELAAGFGGAEAVKELAAAQGSINRALLANIVQRAWSTQPSSKEAWQLLIRLDGEGHDEALASTLAHPYFRSWAVGALGSEPGHAPLAYLSGLALAVATRVGTEAELAIAVRDGAAYIPSYGRFLVPGSEKSLLIRTSGGQFSTNLAGARWSPTHSVHCDQLRVYLEDSDPERDVYDHPVHPQLSANGRRAWTEALTGAWQVILRHHAGYAPGLAAGLQMIVPLAAVEGEREISATARNAFGAAAVALPSSPNTLALLLIHEFQHAKLGALFDLYNLFDHSDKRLYCVPWKTGLRPLEGLFQGAYAHLAIADFWRARRAAAATSTEALEAGTNFVHWRDSTAGAIEVLAESGSLTARGSSFVDSMRATVAPWLDEKVDRDMATPVSTVCRQHREDCECLAAPGSQSRPSG
jgi:uncharacterized protein